jgi:uncharacterized protein
MKISRRNFLKTSTAISAGLSIPWESGFSQNTLEDKPKIKKYKPLGKTGFMVSDISSGGGSIKESGIAQYMFESGINYIDTAFQYPGSEEAIGEILAPWRDKVFITTKWDPPLVTTKVTKAELLEALDISLKRLKTNYVDCMMIHSIGDPNYGGLERIQNPAIYEAWDEAKKLGKIKYTGASSHGINLIRDMEWCIDSGRFDIITVGLNFIAYGLEPLLRKAKSKGMGTVAIKCMASAKSNLKYKQFINQEVNIRQALIKWVLTQDYIDTMVLSMRNYEQIAEYLKVSGFSSLNESEKKLLKGYKDAVSPEYCRPGCDGCSKACPNGLPIWDIQRYLMYFENYGREKYAMEKYNSILANCNAEKCIDCPAPCEKSCKYGIRIRERLINAHLKLKINPPDILA